MQRIKINLFDDIHLWFSNTYGEPQEWRSTTTEPAVLNSKHQWALGGRTVDGGRWTGFTRENCIWCSDEVFTMYALAKS